MYIVSDGVNYGEHFPSLHHVENFFYNGFMGNTKKGFAKWYIVAFLEWTNDPGIGKFQCSDGKERLIPSFALNPAYNVTLPKPPEFRPFEGKGLLFGESSNS